MRMQWHDLTNEWKSKPGRLLQVVSTKVTNHGKKEYPSVPFIRIKESPSEAFRQGLLVYIYV